MKIILWLTLTTLSAAPITFESRAGLATSHGPTIEIAPHPAWYTLPGSPWISSWQSGNPARPDYFSPPNGTIVTFTDTFTLDGTPTGGALAVIADDSTSVMLNAILLLAEAPSAGTTYKTCSDIPIGCLQSTMAVFDLTPYLISGINTLTFGVAQRGEVALGLNYQGWADATHDTNVPEPAFLVFFLAILAFIGGAGLYRELTRRRIDRRASVASQETQPYQ